LLGHAGDRAQGAGEIAGDQRFDQRGDLLRLGRAQDIAHLG
jgi:hypothetical protein